LLSANQYGLSLALGGAEVSPLDMAEAFGVFANSGLKTKPTGILSITNTDGDEIETFSSTTVQVIPKQTALLMNDVLADPVARASIFGTNYFGGRQVAIKTGTTNDSRDAWMIGYTPSVSVAAWMGNNNNSPMAQQASARIIGPMWKGFMDWVLENKVPDEVFERPEPASSSTKPFLTGTWQGPGSEVHSELYWVNRSDPAGTPPGYASNDPLFRNFEAGVLNWAGSAAGLNSIISTTPVTPINNTSAFNIIVPSPNSALNKNDRITVAVAGTDADTTQVEYYVNNILIGKSTESPFSFSFIPSSIPGIQDENELKAVATQRIGKFLESRVFFSTI
jgi:penicillin-binding protein 1A